MPEPIVFHTCPRSRGAALQRAPAEIGLRRDGSWSAGRLARARADAGDAAAMAEGGAHGG